MMRKIYKYTHKQKTVRSIILALPAFLLVASAFLWKYAGLTIAQRFIQLNLQVPHIIQLIVWIILPLWSLWQARKAYKYGTVTRYRKYNVLALLMSGLTLLLFAIIIAVSYL